MLSFKDRPGKKQIHHCVAILVLLLLEICIPHAAVKAQTIHLKPFAIRDSQMGGITAFQIIAPADWHKSGGVFWNSNLANLVVADVSISAPDQSAGFFIHPSPLFISGQIENQWPQGQLYLGMVARTIPNSPVDYLRQFVLPQRRSGVQNLHLIKHEDLPQWASQIATTNGQPGGITQGYGTCARFSYTENGEDWEEDFYCVLIVSRANMGPQNLFWLADRNMSVRAKPGRLNMLKPLANIFVNSFRLDKRWYGRFIQVQRQWIAFQQQQIADAGALSDAISRANDQFDQAMMKTWDNRQRAEERASREFSEYIRGTENYSDPVNDIQVELPGGYGHAWTNTMGEYILTDDSGFDPNRNSNADWEPINRAP